MRTRGNTAARGASSARETAWTSAALVVILRRLLRLAELVPVRVAARDR
ncbi:MAG TPA: hypothetical protein VHG53_05895 [Candidatus Limnocylindria bacterium]|nr:hypothetical protein [Candidatus Limnocylindria bacterium]